MHTVNFHNNLTVLYKFRPYSCDILETSLTQRNIFPESTIFSCSKCLSFSPRHELMSICFWSASFLYSFRSLNQNNVLFFMSSLTFAVWYETSSWNSFKYSTTVSFASFAALSTLFDSLASRSSVLLLEGARMVKDSPIWNR